MKKLIIALAGNPNSGKTTLFNQLTGSNQRVGNWSGVTVERKEGQFTTSRSKVKLLDLPGTYSLTTISEQASLDEKIACNYILNGDSDLIINVIDASKLERNLYLTLQLLELRVPCIVVLNMQDIARSQNINIDIALFSKRIGCPVVPMISTKAIGIDMLHQMIDNHYVNDLRVLVSYPPLLLKEVAALSDAMSDKIPTERRRWLALQMLEGDIYSTNQADSATALLPIAKRALQNQEDPALIIADARYQSIAILCNEVGNSQEALPNRPTEILDKVILNRWMGIPIFLLVMYLMFLMAINIGGALQPIFDIMSEAIFIQGIHWIGSNLDLPKWLTLFLVQGIGGGIHTLLPLVPQIGMMYLFLSFLEDSGYMARAVFVIDRLMRVLGLPGKSFVSLIIGLGCNVPSIMSARTLDAKRERIMTIMMAPFMSCGARLAIFVVFSSVFFGKSGVGVIFSLYILGILVAIFTGLVLKYTIIGGETLPFLVELPPYHTPNVKILLLQTWQQLKDFILRGGKIVVIASAVISGLNSFTFSGKPVDNINDSALASISKVITPFLNPIGVRDDNWQATVGLVSGAMAKEVVVGTLNTLYADEWISAKELNESSFNLLDQTSRALRKTWEGTLHAFSPSVLSNPIRSNKGEGGMEISAMRVMKSKFGSDVSAYSYLIFVLLYTPCASVMGAIARESNRAWMIFSILWGLNVAYSLAALFYQTITFVEHPEYSQKIILIVSIANIFILCILRYARDGIAILMGNVISAPYCKKPYSEKGRL